MFNEKDIIHLSNMMELIRDKLVLTDLDCMGVSKAYKAFEWMQGLEEKFIESDKKNMELESIIEEHKEYIRLTDICIEKLESQLRDSKKKPRKKKK